MQPIKIVDIPHWRTAVPDENFLDVFTPEFVARCDRMANEVATPVKDDPFLIGYTMTDCPLLTEEDCRERPDVIGGARRESVGRDVSAILASRPLERRLMGGPCKLYTGIEFRISTVPTELDSIPLMHLRRLKTGDRLPIFLTRTKRAIT